MSDKMENRLRVRRKMIEYLKANKKINANTKILDVGAGDGYTSYYLLNPDIEKHLYFALDISKVGLEFLRDRIKSAITIRSTIEAIPFAPKSFDVIFIWGALHHTKNKEKIIGPLTKLLKKDGYILMYEGLRPESSLLKLSGRMMKRIINESAHEDRISETRIKKELRSNLKVVWYKKEYTPVRTLLVVVLYKLGILDKYDFVNNIVIAIDYLLINTLGKIMKSFSGGAVSVIGIKK
jgi:ubiquinone/menaquinone biosynthesis C-methylase UbiE